MCVLVRVPTRVLTKDLECCNENGFARAFGGDGGMYV